MSEAVKPSVAAMRTLALRLKEKLEQKEQEKKTGRLAKIKALLSRFLHKTNDNPVRVINDYGGYFKYAMVDPGFRTKARSDQIDKMRVAWLQGAKGAPPKPKPGKSGS